jgi:phosphate:Na+ symporter
MDYTKIIFEFLGSLGLFLFGMTVLSSALQKTAGCQMKHLLGKMSKTRFRGVLFGAGVTAIIQSSTATTVMAVGFVNAGIISLTQIVGIIMGANIGSTTTSWLVSSTEWLTFLKPSYLGAIFAAGGALMLLFSKKGRIRNIGEVVVGFGVLFIGLSKMPEAVKPLQDLPAVSNLFVTLGGNPILALLVGVLVTAVIQSSTASIGILQSLAFTGIIPWNAAVFIVLGQNVGTCFTTMLTSIGANRNTRAASYVHFVYNAVGAVVFAAGAAIFFGVINPAFGETMASSTNVSMIHTGYNIALLMILFPFGGHILRLAVKMAGKETAVDDDRCEFTDELDENILETPQFALENSVKAVVKLTDVLRTNLITAKSLIIEYTSEKTAEFWVNIKNVDRANETVRRFLTKLYNERAVDLEISVVVLLQNLTSLQRISNHTKGIVKQLESLEYEGVKYVEKLDSVVREIYEKTLSCYDDAVEILTKPNTTREIIERAVTGAETVQGMREKYKSGHIERVSSGVHDIESDSMFMEIVRHMSRIVSHTKSIAESAVSDEH